MGLYLCKKHGSLDDDYIATISIAGVVTARLCSRCYLEWIQANVPEVETVYRDQEEAM